MNSKIFISCIFLRVKLDKYEQLRFDRGSSKEAIEINLGLVNNVSKEERQRKIKVSNVRSKSNMSIIHLVCYIL